jgi:4-hydroxybenzoate polyprenyltransferase
MGFNRIVDRRIDAANPRTAGRELPSGRLSVAWMAGLVVAGVLLFVLAAARLNPLCLALTPVALVVLFGYSLTKRFTAASHLVLGLALGIAPVGAWIAVRGRFALLPILLCLAVTFWTAGFDVLYSLQDVDFDRQSGLFSIPARLGEKRSLVVSRLFHLATVLLLVAAWQVSGRGWIFLAGIALSALLLAWEQSLVRPGDLSKLDAAFFTANGLVSVVLFLAGALDLALLAAR